MKKLNLQQAKDRIHRYCAYQERSHQEVRSKLFSFGISGNDVEETMADLISEGFLNEERFAKAFAGGKFRIKKWGRLKIIHALENKGLSRNCIKAGIAEIDNDDYLNTLKNLIADRSSLNGETNIYVKRDLVSKFAISKGYEPELVWAVIKELLPE